MQLAVIYERQKVWAMGAAQIEQATTLPVLSQRLQLTAEYRPVPEVIPAGGYLVEGLRIYLTPCIPLSFKGEGEDLVRGGCAPSMTPRTS